MSVNTRDHETQRDAEEERESTHRSWFSYSETTRGSAQREWHSLNSINRIPLRWHPLNTSHRTPATEYHPPNIIHWMPSTEYHKSQRIIGDRVPASRFKGNQCDWVGFRVEEARTCGIYCVHLDDTLSHYHFIISGAEWLLPKVVVQALHW